MLTPTIIKFLYAMGVVAVSAAVLFGGLTVYKRFFMKGKQTQDELKSPETVDDAVSFFINKNKLKGFGAIDLLIGLVIMAIIFMTVMPSLHGGFGFGKGGALNTQSAKEQAEQMINEIEQLRQQQQLKIGD